MAEPKHVYHRNLKTLESQMERVMGIPLLRISVGQRTYLLGHSNYEGRCVFNLYSPSGKANMFCESHAGAGADSHFLMWSSHSDLYCRVILASPWGDDLMVS